MKHVLHFAARFFAAAFFINLAAPDFSAAHGTDYRILDSEPATVVEFIYSDNQPMRFAEVLVFSPEDDEIEHQNGRTDMNGRFAFYPDVSGKWRIQADDGAGHLERVRIEIGEAKNGTEARRAVGDRSEASGHQHNDIDRLLLIAFGISLIANLFLSFYMYRLKTS